MIGRTEEKPDRWYVSVDLWDHETGTRRSADATITEGGDLAEEALDAVMAVMVRAGQHEHFMTHVETLAAERSDGRPSAVLLEVKCGRHRDAEVLDRLVGVMDDAGWMKGAEVGPVARVRALLDLVASAEPMRAAPVTSDGDAEEGLPRTLREPAGEDPADEAPETFRGRPVEQVDLPDPEPAEVAGDDR